MKLLARLSAYLRPPAGSSTLPPPYPLCPDEWETILHHEAEREAHAAVLQELGLKTNFRGSTVVPGP